MNPLLLALLAQMNQGNQNNQNPLMALLNNQQDPTQQLLAAFGGGSQQNDQNSQLVTLLLGALQNQQQQQDPTAQLLQALQGNGNQKQNGNLDLSKLLEALNGEKPKSQMDQLMELLKGNQQQQPSDNSNNEENDIIAQLIAKSKQQKDQQSNQADLEDAIKFNLAFDAFISENDELFPDWFSLTDVKDDVDKWAKSESDKAQGLAAATVKAFFKNDSMLDLLEERDRNTVNTNILREGLKSHEIDRSVAWPVLERAIHNHKQLSENHTPVASGKDDSAIASFGGRFEQGQNAGQEEDAA